jgi:hypothetical protein
MAASIRRHRGGVLFFPEAAVRGHSPVRQILPTGKTWRFFKMANGHRRLGAGSFPPAKK